MVCSVLYANKGKVDILVVINGILGALVGVTAGIMQTYSSLQHPSKSEFCLGCAVVTTGEAFIIGIVGSFLANISADLLIWLKIDDAVGATCVHGRVISEGL